MAWRQRTRHGHTETTLAPWPSLLLTTVGYQMRGRTAQARRMRRPVFTAMSQEAILEKVRSIVAEQLSVDAGEVKPESNFQNDLGADSLDTVELVMALEEAFDIEIPDEAAEGITTVGDAVKYIEDKQA